MLVKLFIDVFEILEYELIAMTTQISYIIVNRRRRTDTSRKLR